MTIRFVFFDIGNVLYRFDPQRSYRQIAEVLRSHPEADDVGKSTTVIEADQVRYHMADLGLGDAIERGELSTEQWASHLRDGLEIPHAVAPETLAAAAGDMFTLIEGMPDLVRRIRPNCQLGLLSNTCDPHWRNLLSKPDGMIASIEHRVLSFEVGAMKPAAKIYEAAEKVANRFAEPHQVLFFDDKIENVAAARRRGWKAEVTSGLREVRDASIRHGVAV